MDSEGNYEMPQEEALTVQEQRAKYGEEKPKAKDTARLIWASKPKKEPNAKDLEFQTAEEVYPNIADIKDKKLSRFWTETKDISDDPNRLIWGDNLLVMQALLAQDYEGQIDLIYIDPPFNTGEDFNFSSSIAIGNETFSKELPINERLAYMDTWKRGFDSFLDMIYPRFQVMKRLLSSKGSIFVHCDYHASHFIKLLLDEIFGRNHFVNEICWRRANSKTPSNKLAVIHDTIFWYSTKDEHIFNSLYHEYKKGYVEEKYPNVDKDGRRYQLQAMYGKGSGQALKFGDKIISPPPGSHWRWSQEHIDRAINEGIIVFSKGGEGKPRFKDYLDTKNGIPLQSIWNDIPDVNSQAGERTNYPTQKPEALLSRIIELASNKDSIIADFFCGSGTTAAVAEKLGRKWITSDLSKTAIQVTRGRLVNQNSNPFIIENLGNYQRQLIYTKEVNIKQMYDIILKLYGATPRNDWQGFGTAKEDNKSLIFVCEPDRSMTARKAIELAKFARTADGKGYKRLIILAWDYDYDFDDVFDRMKKNVKSDMADVEFKIIPSDVYRYLKSTKAGDSELKDKITFYQKPYIVVSEPNIIRKGAEEAQVKLKIEKYTVMDIPVKDESKRPEIQKLLGKNFAFLIDYWTVDWDYDGEVFRSKWQAIRDRKSSEPVPIIAESTLVKGKKYTIAVRVVDVFGNDASVTREIDLR